MAKNLFQSKDLAQAAEAMLAHVRQHNARMV